MIEISPTIRLQIHRSHVWWTWKINYSPKMRSLWWEYIRSEANSPWFHVNSFISPRNVAWKCPTRSAPIKLASEKRKNGSFHDNRENSELMRPFKFHFVFQILTDTGTQNQPFRWYSSWVNNEHPLYPLLSLYGILTWNIPEIESDYFHEYEQKWWILFHLTQDFHYILNS